jgi:Endonuclease/Exonuclease/phosphatase family
MGNRHSRATAAPPAPESSPARDGMLRRGTFTPRDKEVQWDSIKGLFDESEACEARLPGHIFAVDRHIEIPTAGVESGREGLDLGAWRSLSEESSFPSSEETEFPAALRVVSYNIWFAELFWEERLDATVELVRSARADVVCLQEVTTRALFRLRDDPFVREDFVLSDVTGFSVHNYGVATLVRRDLVPFFAGFRLVDMASNMGRRILVAEFRKAMDGAAAVAVATVHLESLNSAPVRKAQLAVASRLMAGYDTALLCGDFNITATGTYGDPAESSAVLDVLGEAREDGWHDVWLTQCQREAPQTSQECEEREDAYTFDVVGNKMLGRRGPEGGVEERGRIDRACVRGVDIDRCTVRVIGNGPLEKQPAGAERPIYPSDHFGLEILVARKKA